MERIPNGLFFGEDLEVVDDSTPLLSHVSPTEKCRLGRVNYQRKTSENLTICIMKFVLFSSGYRDGGVLSRLYSGYLLLLCWFQFVYSFYTAIFCAKEGCDFTGDGRPSYSFTARNEQIGFAISSLGAAASYTLLLFCVIIPAKRTPLAITPKEALRDIKAGKLSCLFLWLMAICVLYAGLSTLYFYFLFVTLRLWQDCIVVVGTVSMFMGTWTSIASCVAFGMSSLALGTFADDTVRRLKEMKGKHLDDAIIIHRELKSIVSTTVKVYCKWFIFHWFLYALASVLAIIVVADVHFKTEHTLKKFYFGFFFAVHVFMFVFPCGCAAYVTGVCGAIGKKLNNTLSVEWRNGHLLQNRSILQQFVAYANGSPVSFRIGRVTFNTTIAWVSFFLGFTGLLFHFF